MITDFCRIHGLRHLLFPPGAYVSGDERMVDGEEEADRGGEIAVPSIQNVIAICFPGSTGVASEGIGKEVSGHSPAPTIYRRLG